MDVFKFNMYTLCVVIIVLFFNRYVTCNGETVSDAESDGMCYCTKEVASALRGPVSVQFFVEKGEERMIVVEQLGVATVRTTTGQELRTFLDISDNTFSTSSINVTNERMEIRSSTPYSKTPPKPCMQSSNISESFIDQDCVDCQIKDQVIKDLKAEINQYKLNGRCYSILVWHGMIEAQTLNIGFFLMMRLF